MAGIWQSRSGTASAATPCRGPVVPPSTAASFMPGGRDLPDYADVTRRVVSRNITSDPEDGIGKWSDAEVKRAIAAGIRPDGTRLAHTMPYDWYKAIAPADLDAITAYLRTLPPIKTPGF